MGFIYKITCLITGRPYIGLTTRQIEDRWKEHLATGKRHIVAVRNMEEFISNSKLYKAMVDHGIDNFTIEAIEEVPDNKDLDAREIHWIKYYDSVINGYNIMSGGRGAKFNAAMMARDINNIRTHKRELEGLPMYCTYDSVKCMISVKNHPLCDCRSFKLTAYDNNLEKVKYAVLSFIDELETLGIPYDANNKYNGAGKNKSLGTRKAKALNIENLRPKYKDELTGLPAKCHHIIHKGKPTIKVEGHKWCDNKNFNIEQYGGLENTKKTVLEFLADLEAKGEKYEPETRTRPLPKGISRLMKGNAFRGWRARTDINGNHHEEFFSCEKGKFTGEEVFYKALASLNQFRKKHNLEEIVFNYDDINKE
nr:GIY-YIG catalytic domain-containing endonuclease [Faustovirus]